MLELLGKKIGMTHIFNNEEGSSSPLTMVQLYDNCIIDAVDNKDSARLRIGFKKLENTKNLSKSQIGVFKKKSLPVCQLIHESDSKTLMNKKSGDEIEVSSLMKIGDKVLASGISTGKGFAGGMKRWNFGGLEASHGVSVSHRSIGSSGQCQDPGKVFKGKKMPGRLGGKRVSVKNLEVLYFDQENLVIGLKGSIPGTKNSEIVIKLDK